MGDTTPPRGIAPAFRHARVQVARLAELAADDAAAQRSPRLTVAEALHTLSAAPPVLLSVPGPGCIRHVLPLAGDRGPCYGRTAPS